MLSCERGWQEVGRAQTGGRGTLDQSTIGDKVVFVECVCVVVVWIVGLSCRTLLSVDSSQHYAAQHSSHFRHNPFALLSLLIVFTQTLLTSKTHFETLSQPMQPTPLKSYCCYFVVVGGASHSPSVLLLQSPSPLFLFGVYLEHQRVVCGVCFTYLSTLPFS